MENNIRLLMGLVSGFALIMLNNDVVQETINLVSILFDPTKTDTIWFSIGTWLSRACVFLSFFRNISCYFVFDFNFKKGTI